MSQALQIRTAPSDTPPTGVVVVYAQEGTGLGPVAAALWAKTGLDWEQVSTAASFRGKQGQVLDLVAPGGLAAKRLLVLGAGRVDPGAAFSPTAWADRGGSLMAKLAATGADAASVLLETATLPEAVGELAAGLRLRHYRFDKYKNAKRGEDPKPDSVVVTLLVTDPAAADAAIASRGATVDGTLLARELMNEPANVLGTEEFAARALELGQLGVDVEVLGEEPLRALKMNAMLAVSAGSVRPPQLVVMQWNGGVAGEAPVAFVGKGVVFDTGGISIKPAANMEDMKGDMGGAAAVLGLMLALATRKAKVNAVGVLGIVENMPSGTAMRPGDVVRAMAGVTIEINNTDAEGRLVLADALCYTQQRFQPKTMINLATLTGAINVALGADHAGLFSNNDELALKLTAAGLTSGEKLWRMPMGPAYDKLIDSRFADIKNSAGRPGAAITAAQFLRRFVVGETPWAHLDIAGVALGPPANEINTSWAPGFGVALLDRYVRDNHEG